MEGISWVVYVLAVIAHWFKRWLVVRDYSRRPERFRIPGPSGFLIIIGWILLAFALVLFALQYSVIVSSIIGAATGVLLHLLTRLYFRREVGFWIQYYLDLADKLDEGDLELVPGYQVSPPSFAVCTDSQNRRQAEEFATKLVLSIRRSPIGKGEVD